MTVSGAGGEEQVEPGVKGYESSSRAWKGMQQQRSETGRKDYGKEKFDYSSYSRFKHKAITTIDHCIHV